MVNLIWFLLGLALGSAANAIIDRLPRNKSWLEGRSECDSCGHKLNFWDLIPVFSYLSLGGKCRYCHKPIPSRNLEVELFMGLGFVLLKEPILVGMLWVGTIIFVMDWETQLVSELMVLIWAVLVIVGFGVGGTQVMGVVVGVALIGGVWAISRGRAMGFGDVEIAAVMGLWLGWPKIIVALWIAFVLGGGFGAWKLMGGKMKLKSQIAFGPFLMIGTWVAYFFGNMMWQWLFH